MVIFPARIKLSLILRECDHRANSILKKHSQVEKLSQMPVVLLPLHFDREPYSTKVGPCQRSVVIRYAFFSEAFFERKLRPFISSDFMTGRAAIPGEDVSEECINEMEKEICEVSWLIIYNFTLFSGSGNYKTTLRFDFKAARHDRMGIDTILKLPDFFYFHLWMCIKWTKLMRVFYLLLIERRIILAFSEAVRIHCKYPSTRPAYSGKKIIESSAV